MVQVEINHLIDISQAAHGILLWDFAETAASIGFFENTGNGVVNPQAVCCPKADALNGNAVFR